MRRLQIGDTLVLAHTRVYEFIALAKPELTLLSVFTAMGGGYLGAQEGGSLIVLLWIFLGTLLVGASAGALNMAIEYEFDGRMKRTELRPIPAGRVTRSEAIAFGILCGILGITVLLVFTNWIAGLLAILTLVTYLFLYTPLKRLTPFATIFGAVPGALPPVIGWAAARGEIGLPGWSLFAILFFWQIPHFLSLAWIYRADYARAKYRLLTTLDPEGKATRRQILIHAFVLLPASILPTYLGILGRVYFVGALLLSLSFLAVAVTSVLPLTGHSARRLFVASLVYPMLLVLLMVADRI